MYKIIPHEVVHVIFSFLDYEERKDWLVEFDNKQMRYHVNKYLYFQKILTLEKSKWINRMERLFGYFTYSRPIYDKLSKLTSDNKSDLYYPPFEYLIRNRDTYNGCFKFDINDSDEKCLTNPLITLTKHILKKYPELLSFYEAASYLMYKVETTKIQEKSRDYSRY